MSAAAEAGALTCLFTNPLFLVKTRMQLQSSNADPSLKYNGTIDALMKITRTEGVRGLYRGLIPSLFLVSHGSIQFLIYENLKYNFQKDNQTLVFDQYFDF